MEAAHTNFLIRSTPQIFSNPMDIMAFIAPHLPHL